MESVKKKAVMITAAVGDFWEQEQYQQQNFEAAELYIPAVGF